MDVLCPVLLAHSDDRHFQDPTLIGAPEGGMGLHTAAQDDPIRLVCILVHKDGHPLLGLAHLDHLHGGEDGTAQKLLCHPIAAEDLQLALRGGSPVATHGREHKGLSPTGLHKIHDSPGNDGDIGHPPAPAGNGHPHPRSDPGPHRLQLPLYQSRDLLRLNVAVVQLLADLHHSGQLRRGGQLGHNISLFVRT